MGYETGGITRIGKRGLVGSPEIVRLENGRLPDGLDECAAFFGFVAQGSLAGQSVKRNVYIIAGDGITKVGVADDVDSRLYDLRAGNPFLTLYRKRSVPRFFALQVEKQAHTALAEYAIGREWFRVTPELAWEALLPIVKRAGLCHTALCLRGLYDEPEPSAEQRAYQSAAMEKALAMCAAGGSRKRRFA